MKAKKKKKRKILRLDIFSRLWLLIDHASRQQRQPRTAKSLCLVVCIFPAAASSPANWLLVFCLCIILSLILVYNFCVSKKIPLRVKGPVPVCPFESREGKKRKNLGLRGIRTLDLRFTRPTPYHLAIRPPGLQLSNFARSRITNYENESESKINKFPGPQDYYFGTCPFLWHFNEKQRAELIFKLSRHVSCKNQENGDGKQWALHAPLHTSYFILHTSYILTGLQKSK